MNTPNVAAALIVNEAGEVLCTLRGASKHASVAHKWEFPGGKIEPGETAEQAAVREVQEELGLAIEPLGAGCTVEHAYPEFTVRLNGVLCAAKGSTWTLREHLDARWVAPDRLEELDFAAADTAILLWLKERFFGSCLRTERFGRYPTFLAECTSTNDEALRLAEAGNHLSLDWLRDKVGGTVTVDRIEAHRELRDLANPLHQPDSLGESGSPTFEERLAYR